MELWIVMGYVGIGMFIVSMSTLCVLGALLHVRRWLGSEPGRASSRAELLPKLSVAESRFANALAWSGGAGLMCLMVASIGIYAGL